MAGSWVNDCVPVQSVFGRTGNVVAQSGDYASEQVSFDTSLQVAMPPDVKQAIDAVYDVSPMGDRPCRVINDDFTSPLYAVGSSVTIVADAATIGAGVANAALSAGIWGWDASGAGASLLREVPSAGSTMSGVWTIRSSATTFAFLWTRSQIYTAAHSRLRLVCRLQPLPVAQTVGVGFFDSARANVAAVEFFGLTGTVFQMRFTNSKATVTKNVTLPHTSINSEMTVVLTVANNGTAMRVAVYDATGRLIGVIQEYDVPFANTILSGVSTRAGVYVIPSGNPANTPLVRVDYLELGIA